MSITKQFHEPYKYIEKKKDELIKKKKPKQKNNVNMKYGLGLDSTFGGLEAMITGLCDEYPNFLRRHREIFVGVLLVFIYLCSLPTTTYVSLS